MLKVVGAIFKNGAMHPLAAGAYSASGQMITMVVATKPCIWRGRARRIVKLYAVKPLFEVDFHRRRERDREESGMFRRGGGDAVYHSVELPVSQRPAKDLNLSSELFLSDVLLVPKVLYVCYLVRARKVLAVVAYSS